MRICTTLLLMGMHLGIITSALAQPAPMKWGRVPEEHLAMKTFPADTNATAVILADYGTVSFNSDWSYRFERHRRIKILSEAGYEWGTHVIPHYAAEDYDRVSAVRGQTIKMGADGKVETVKLDKKSIFKEKVDGEYELIKFTLPALEPGAVVEYSYTVTTKYPTFLPAWDFQTSEPTLWSEFVTEVPAAELAYARLTRGYLNFAIEEEIEATRPWGTGRLARYVMKDVPALRDEPFMTTPNDYRAHIRYQLAEYAAPGIGVRRFLRTWDELAKQLMDMDTFGNRLGRGRAVRQHVVELTSDIDDPLEKLLAVYDYVRTSINWNGIGGIFMDKEIPDVLKSKTGNSPEINLLLVSMLREAGLDAHPVLISTRSHGSIVDSYPLLSQFDAVLAYASVAGKVYLMDATDPLRPHTLLPIQALSGRGWLLHEKGNEWIPIHAPGKLKRHVLVIAQLDDLGGISGSVQTVDTDYNALDRRESLSARGTQEEFVRDVVLGDLPEVSIDSFEIEAIEESIKPLKTSAHFSLPSYASAAGDFMYVNPVLLDRIDENPLRLAERTFPVDFATPWDYMYTARFELPEGYTVLESPSSTGFKIASGGAKFERLVESAEGALTITTRLIIEKPVFPPRQYQELRKFFDQVVAAQAEQVVIKRNEAASGTSLGED